MANYKLTFTIPFKLSAYDHVTLKERLERELQSYFYDKDIEAHLADEDW